VFAVHLDVYEIAGEMCAARSWAPEPIMLSHVGMALRSLVAPGVTVSLSCGEYAVKWSAAGEVKETLLHARGTCSSGDVMDS
jgi:hypothetical protein